MRGLRQRLKEKRSTRASTPFLTRGSDSSTRCRSRAVLPRAKTKSKIDLNENWLFLPFELFVS